MTLTKQLINIIESDDWMIQTLKTVRDLNLNDCWIGAGFVRNKIWDYKHGKKRTELNDIDVIYYNKTKALKNDDLLIENKLKTITSNLNWSVKNQARMHIKNNHKQYINCYEAISFWPDTATSIAIRLTPNNTIDFIAPYGLDDLFNLMVIPTPQFDLNTYHNRIKKKNWKEKWNKLNIKTSHRIIQA
ncbi:nucleotidyltransferase family protein [Aestuariivivens insulae]|uniref:nucleotidyltransferase family protein n=1 Tax=Aestuariivivens insulae TaxID=1621988 RepID=UPI001F597DB1|nr:nucleotidyltransferase family protein [Aestuariivivens insulae]